jgi:hypothetical protein
LNHLRRNDYLAPGRTNVGSGPSWTLDQEIAATKNPEKLLQLTPQQEQQIKLTHDRITAEMQELQKRLKAINTA